MASMTSNNLLGSQETKPSSATLCQSLLEEMMRTSLRDYLMDCTEPRLDDNRIQKCLDLIKNIEDNLKPDDDSHGSVHHVINEVKRFFLEKIFHYEKCVKVMHEYWELKKKLEAHEEDDLKYAPQKLQDNFDLIERYRYIHGNLAHEMTRLFEDEVGRIRLPQDDSLRCQVLRAFDIKRCVNLSVMEHLMKKDKNLFARHKEWLEEIEKMKTEIEVMKISHEHAKKKTKKMKKMYASLRRKLAALVD
ncbi:hypothetical protein RIF29_40226 [Crotalaria pallida]|uniref:Uncharacterized protein n=1 Tax=Crotalaria pallida TaxID=3830 RepID=A0AAN9HQI1_CROPI